MGFEAAVNLETKLTEIQKLVSNGVLTQTDYDLCRRALTKKDKLIGCFYRDENMAAYYKGIGLPKGRFMNGDGIAVNLIVENRIDKPISVYMTISVNGIIVNMESNIIRNLPIKSKIIVQEPLSFDKLELLDVTKVEDIESLSFSFKCVDAQYRTLSNYSKPKKIVL